MNMKKCGGIILISILVCSGFAVASPLRKTGGTEQYNLLIITPSVFLQEFTSFVTHKEHFEVHTKLVTLDEIYTSVYFPVTGRDDAEKVKYFIKNALDNWAISYVLLVGGRQYGVNVRWYMPVRYVENEAWNEKTYISDLYFADIYNETGVFQTWDTNGDNVFGKLNVDHMDLHPDVFVGRWACRNRNELKTIIEKTIAYESAPEKTRRVVLVGGDTFNDSETGSNTSYDEGELITNQTADYLEGYEPVRVFSSSGLVSAKTIRDALGDGASFMHFSGHGWVLYWNTYKHGKEFIASEPGIGIWDMPSFKNTQYPIVVWGGCVTGMFDVSFFHRPYVWRSDADLPKILKFFPGYECIAWFFNRNKGSGSVASLAYTISPVGAAGEHGDLDHDKVNKPDCIEAGYGYLENNFFAAYGQNGRQHLGECWGDAENMYMLMSPFDIYNLRTIQSFILFGDPSLKIGGYAE